MRVWFNNTFSSVYAAISLIREADTAGVYHITYSSTNPYAAAGGCAHRFELEPKACAREAYLEWCLEFCRANGIDIFIPGREASLISGARARFAQVGTRVLSVADEGVLDLLHEKARFYAAVDLPVAAPPAFRAIENIQQFDAAYAELKRSYSRLCIKPSRSVYGPGFQHPR